jgi:hypothetical protein
MTSNHDIHPRYDGLYDVISGDTAAGTFPREIAPVHLPIPTLQLEPN